MNRHELTPGDPDFSAQDQELRTTVQELGHLFGLSGLQIEVRPGEGWKCTRRHDGITITVDPEQLVERNEVKDADSLETSWAAEVDPRYIVHTAGHELGHGKDFIDPDWRDESSRPGDHFFWNVLDDTVIDKRLRRIPALDGITDQLYGQVLFPTDDLTDRPKHVQFMYSLLVNTVTENEPPRVDPNVAKKLHALTNHEADGEIFDIVETLTDPRTSLRQRRSIANHFIKPLYQELLTEDQQKQPDQSGQSDNDGSGQSGDDANSSQSSSEESFKQHYDNYEKAMHGSNHNHDDQSDEPTDGKNGGDGESQSDHSDAAHGHAQQIAEALKELAADPQAQTTEQQPQQPDPAHQEALTALAGTVAKEMNLKSDDALKYVESLDKWGATIRQTAAVFLQLASPTISTMSPRYEARPRTEGARLHPQQLAKAAMQLASNQEQAVWQSVERRANRQAVKFGGLDVHLLVDVSGSMRGPKASCAAACSQSLLEGIQLARYMASEDDSQYTQPDVRTQVIAFGSGTDILAPLAFEPTKPQKGAVFCNLLMPDSDSTLVSGALAAVHESAIANPERETLVVIISDGVFGDYNGPTRQVSSLPDNAYVSHLLIGSGTTDYISPHHQSVNNPIMLPQALYGVLAGRIRAQEQETA
jgi:hypothetical protein